MAGYVDLHCHWVAGIDDGARTPAESVAMLRALKEIGFHVVVGTPHMRPGMFDNTKEEIERAFARTVQSLDEESDLPELLLASEHHLDDLVLDALTHDGGLPYPPGHAVLVEFPSRSFPPRYEAALSRLRRRKLRPVLAHPERYRPVWEDIEALDPVLDLGAVLLLDVAALHGAHGRKTRKTALRLLEQGYYYAACSDAHSMADVTAAARGIALLHQLVGDEEADFLLRQGPRNILDGRVED